MCLMWKAFCQGTNTDNYEKTAALQDTFAFFSSFFYFYDSLSPAGRTSPWQWGSTPPMVWSCMRQVGSVVALWCHSACQTATCCFCWMEERGRSAFAAARSTTTTSGTRWGCTPGSCGWATEEACLCEFLSHADGFWCNRLLSIYILWPVFYISLNSIWWSRYTHSVRSFHITQKEEVPS